MRVSFIFISIEILQYMEIKHERILQANKSHSDAIVKTTHKRDATKLSCLQYNLTFQYNLAPPAQISNLKQISRNV